MSSSSSSKKTSSPTAVDKFIGMAVSSVFSLCYILTPTWMLLSILMIVFQWPSLNMALLFASPILISAIIPSMASPYIVKRLTPMLNYFDYEQIIETKPIDVRATDERWKELYYCTTTAWCYFLLWTMFCH